MEIWAPFILGLLGSLHCAGMCGPIAMALPLTAKEKSQVMLQSLLYNIGRISTYAFLGLFMGLMGWGVFLAGYQKTFSIILGALLIGMAAFSFSIEQKMFSNKYFLNAFDWVKNKLSGLLSIGSNSSAFRIGLVNGILPCGLVYVALIGALATSDVFSGSLFMASFGLGTLPMMLGLMFFGNLYKKRLHNLRKLIPIGLVLFGILLIYRGIMLDVPLDLRFWESTNNPIMCH